MVLLCRNIAWNLSVSGPVLPLYVRSLGIEIMDWSLLATAHAVGLIFFEGMWGTLSDRVNRTKMLVVALICMSLVFPLYTFKGFVPLFFVLQFAVGALAVAIGPTTRAMVADMVPVESRGYYMSLWFTFFILGGMIGPILGTAIASAMGYEYAFYASSAVLILGAIISGKVLKGIPSDVNLKRSDGEGVLKGARTLISIPSVRYVFLLAVFMLSGMPAIRSFLPIYASEQLGMSDVAIGTMLTASMALQLIVNPVLGRASDRFSKRWLIAAGLVGTIVMFFAYPWASTPLQLAMVTLGVSAFMTVMSLSLAMLSQVAPRGLSGMAMGLYGSSEDLGLIIGPILYGYIWNTYSPSSIFLAGAGTSLLALGVLLLIR